MTTKADLERILEERKARAALPVLSQEDEDMVALRAEIAKADAKIRENERRVRSAKDDDIFERLQLKHVARGDVHRIDSEAGMICLVLPSISKSRHFQQIALKGKLSPDSIEDFVKPAIVWVPGSDEAKLEVDGIVLEGLLEKYTLLAPSLCQFAQDLASAGAAVRGK